MGNLETFINEYFPKTENWNNIGKFKLNGNWANYVPTLNDEALEFKSCAHERIKEILHYLYSTCCFEQVYGFGDNSGIFCTKCNKAVSSTTNRTSAKKNRGNI